MKINMPVTQKEIELADTSSIVSKTDLKVVLPTLTVTLLILAASLRLS